MEAIGYHRLFTIRLYLSFHPSLQIKSHNPFPLSSGFHNLRSVQQYTLFMITMHSAYLPRLKEQKK